MSCGTPEHAAGPWLAPPTDLELPEDGVHVWRATLNLPPAQILGFRSTLSPEERARADHFHFEQDRSRFTTARGILRTILGRYLAVEPDHVRIGYGPQGKPHLADTEMSARLCFNVTHSQGLALFAFALGRTVGVDLERMSSDVEREQLAARFFSAREVAELHSLPPSAQLSAFFQIWTRKEAYVKARGAGLTVPLQEFTVPLLRGSADEPQRVQPSEASADNDWRVLGLDPGAGYAAAVVVQGSGWRAQCWQWARSPGSGIGTSPAGSGAWSGSGMEV